ncbi:hypothetical protein VB780_26020 [Leptolyngbya sp. CCNP1308]|nr:hypothetical protein [Leptolyngbya sp. CCNP1308]MEA5452058.1 hypothetical protein [Leptolyngbya sp. CCNP1308]
MPQTQSQSTNGKTNDSQLRLNYSSSGQLVIRVVKESTDLTFSGPLPIAAGETSASQLEPSTPASSDCGAEGLSPLLREIQLQEEQNGSITISPRMEKQSLAMQTTLFQGYLPGFPKESRSSPPPLATLGDEFFFIKNFASPLSVLMGPEEEMKVELRAEHLSRFKRQGMNKHLLVFWEVWYLTDLLMMYVVSRIEAFTSLIKLIDINLK